MTIYTCPRCTNTFDRRSNFKRHFFRKFPCTNITNIKKSLKECFHDFFTKEETDENEMSDDFVCEYCQKSYSKNSNLTRHVKTCSKKELNYKNSMISKLEAEKNDIVIEKEFFKKELTKLLEKGITNNITTINNTQNIIINNHGKENLSYIKPQHYMEFMKVAYVGVPRLLQNIHFHPNHPENHNIKITNKKLPYISIFQNNQWRLKDKRKTIENLIDNGFHMIDDYYDKYKLSEMENKRYKRYKMEFNNDSRVLKKHLEKSTELVILNESKNIFG